MKNIVLTLLTGFLFIILTFGVVSAVDNSSCITHYKTVCRNNLSVWWQDSCGNYEEFKETCYDYNTTCADGACVGVNYTNTNCITHSQTTCHNNAVWWQDSCGKDEEFKENCQDENMSCSNGVCVSAVCKDSGFNYYQKGSCYDSNTGKTSYDYCDEEQGGIKKGGLEEVSCKYVGVGEGSPELQGKTSCIYNSYTCPYGCKDGACMQSSDSNSCYDTDDKNPNIKGKVTIKGQDYWDYCIVGKPILVEKYCSNGDVKEANYQCSGGCSDGACIGNAIPLDVVQEPPKEKCIDSDNGQDYYSKGSINGYFQGKNNFEDTDYCSQYNPDGDIRVDSCNSDSNQCNVYEYYCASDTSVGRTPYTCPFGCKDGACLKIIPENNTQQPIDINQKIDTIQNEVVKEAVKKNIDYSSLCQGCALDTKCYPFGFRKDKTYCDDNSSTFIVQKISNSECNNNFECDSNLCVNNSCVSGSLWAKIMSWFSHLFGGK